MLSDNLVAMELNLLGVISLERFSFLVVCLASNRKLTANGKNGCAYIRCAEASSDFALIPCAVRTQALELCL